jgi:hypothetical protein
MKLKYTLHNINATKRSFFNLTEGRMTFDLLKKNIYFYEEGYSNHYTITPSNYKWMKEDELCINDYFLSKTFFYEDVNFPDEF